MTMRGLSWSREDEAHAALLAVDVTEEVLDEAERLGCDLVVTHHPIVFHALEALQFGGHGAALRRTGHPPRHRAVRLPHQPRQRSGRHELASGRDAGRREPPRVAGPRPRRVSDSASWASSRKRSIPWSSCALFSGGSGRASYVTATSPLPRCAAWPSAPGRGLAHRRRTPRRGRFLPHGRHEVQRLHDAR